jgi:hypothetical protein
MYSGIIVYRVKVTPGVLLKSSSEVRRILYREGKVKVEEVSFLSILLKERQLWSKFYGFWPRNRSPQYSIRSASS